MNFLMFNVSVGMVNIALFEGRIFLDKNKPLEIKDNEINGYMEELEDSVRRNPELEGVTSFLLNLIFGDPVKTKMLFYLIGFLPIVNILLLIANIIATFRNNKKNDVI